MTFIDAFSQPFACNSFSNLPVSIAVPNTYSMRLPKGLKKFAVVDEEEHGDGSLARLMQIVEESVKLRAAAGTTKIMLCFDDLTQLLQGCEEDDGNTDLTLLEVLNGLSDLSSESTHDNVSLDLVLGINRSLLFGNQKAIYRDIKENEFDIAFEISRNEAGYN